MAYIYKIVNDINGKIYIGKTEFSIEKRFKEHCQDAFRDRNEKRPLYAAMRKYGIEHFHIELIEETDNPEEREIYWIEVLRSFKNGYNATLGGDGRRYIDYDLVISTYKEVGNMKKTAKILGIDFSSVFNILHSKNIEIVSTKEILSKTVAMIENDEIKKVFPSAIEAGKYIVEIGLSKADPSGIKSHIVQVCNGKRKSAYGYKWKYI